ncbi:MAG: TolC family protein [Sedimentisphaerales bacterium]|nr:TolC family protein [Sedimentisphaerales bacterium]
METLRAVLCVPVLVGTWSLLLGGCTSQDEFRRDVGLSRKAAYRQWEDRKAREDGAQPRISGRLSMEDCIKLTLVHNKMLQRTMEEKDIAYGARLSAGAAYLPNVSLSGQYLRKDEVPSLAVAGMPAIEFGTLDNYSAVLSVTQPIYAGGAISAQVRAARLLSLVTDEIVRAAVQDVVYAAQTGYYNLRLNQHMVDVSTDAVRSAEVHLDQVEKRRAGGVASDFDVLRAQVELSNFEADLIRSENAIDLARANLIKVMGVSQDSDFALSDELVYAPVEVSMEQAVQEAFTNRPDLYRQEYQIRQQREQLQIARSRYLPNVSGFFTNTWANPDPHSVAAANDWGSAWQAGVQGAWPIFNGFQREGQIIQEKARLKQAQISLVDTEETALYELTQALLSMENAVEFVQSQQLNVTRATEGLRLAEVGYQQGINTQVEMIDAQTALTTARVNYYQAIYSHVVAKLALQRATGTIANGTVAGGSPVQAESRSVQNENG